MVLLIAALLVAACNGQPPTVTPVVPTEDPNAVPTLDPAAAALDIEILNSELAVGEDRIAFRLLDETGQPISDAEVEITIYRIVGGDEARQVASGPALHFGAGLPDGGSYIVYTEFDASGTWALDVNATRPDGWRGQSRVTFEVAGRTTTPRVGERPPQGETPTVDDRALEALTTDRSPDPELYDMTVTEAAGNDRPTVVHFSSPEHCATETCQATLDEIKAVKRQYGDRVDFIHIETRAPDDPTALSAAAEAWGLPSEPWTFVLDSRGRIATRVEGGLGRTELGLLLDRQLGG